MSLTVQTTGEVLPAVDQAAADLEVRISPFLLPRLAAEQTVTINTTAAGGNAALLASSA